MQCDLFSSSEMENKTIDVYLSYKSTARVMKFKFIRITGTSTY